MRGDGSAILIWGGPLGLFFFFLALWPAAGFLPPTPPSTGAEEIRQLFIDNATGIRIASILMLCSVGSFMAYVGAISGVIQRIEGGRTTPLAMAQLAGGVTTFFPFLIVSMIWVTMTYRSDLAPETVRAFNDLAWITLVMPVPSAIIQQIATAIAIARDRSANPLLPRWVIYVNIAGALGFFPAMFLSFFYHGPFAWNGALSFWLGAVDFGILVSVMTVMVWRARLRDEPEYPR